MEVVTKELVSVEPVLVKTAGLVLLATVPLRLAPKTVTSPTVTVSAVFANVLLVSRELTVPAEPLILAPSERTVYPVAAEALVFVRAEAVVFVVATLVTLVLTVAVSLKAAPLP